MLVQMKFTLLADQVPLGQQQEVQSRLSGCNVCDTTKYQALVHNSKVQVTGVLVRPEARQYHVCHQRRVRMDYERGHKTWLLTLLQQWDDLLLVF